MTQQQITLLGNPILAKVAQEVNHITSKETQDIITDMITTVELAGGVGIAAPQINISLRIFLLCSKPNARYPDGPDMPIQAIINPIIISHSENKINDWEGCLSVPKLRGLIPRYESIEVEYFDRYGEKHKQHYHGFVARIFQHELDHLNGLTFVDRVISNNNLVSEDEWYRQFVN